MWKRQQDISVSVDTVIHSGLVNFIPPRFVSTGVKLTRIVNHLPLNFMVVLGAFYHRRVL